MFLFYGIKLPKLKFLIDIVAKFLQINISINIVKKKYNIFLLVRVYEFAVLGFYVQKNWCLKLLIYKLHSNRK